MRSGNQSKKEQGMPFNKLTVIFAAALITLLSGCASITGSPNQSVSVQTRDKTGAEVIGASCELTNNKGKWFVTTPGSVGIHRSNDDMQVLCKKDNFENGRAAVVSDTKGSMFGNILLGGGIGAIVDHNNGSAYEYPTVIDLVMGDFKKIETPKNPTNQQANIQPSQASNPAQTTVPVVAIVPPPAAPPANTASNASVSTVDATAQKLRDLQALRKDGVITENEFQAKKKQLLEKL
jgi:hypothetical protein